MNTPELETERLRLRRFTAEDAAAILAIFGDVEANTFLPWFPLKSLEEARQLFERQYQPVYRAERGYQYAICLKEDDIPIGYVKVDLDESHDLGYGLRHEFWHRGIAAEAAGPGRAGEAGRAALSHSHSRCEQPQQRSGDEKVGNGLSILL